MENSNIQEALKSLEEIKSLFRDRTVKTLLKMKFQFLVWGLYQIISPIVVYYSHNFSYFLLLLPVFFFISLIPAGKILLSFGYWTLSLIIYIVLLRLQIPPLFYTFFILSIFVGFWILSPKDTHRERLSGFFWLNTIVFALLLQFVIFNIEAYPLLYFSWPGIILFGLGSIGVLGETSLLFVALSGNILGALYFIFAPHGYRIFTMCAFGLIYILYFLYLSLKLSNSHG